MHSAIPAELTRIYEKRGVLYGEVRFGGVKREVCLCYEPGARVGDHVLVQSGFAMSRLDPSEAERAWELLLERGSRSDPSASASTETS